METPDRHRVNALEKETFSLPMIRARRPGFQVLWFTNCCRVPVVSTPAGREPGIFLSARELSKHPVARRRHRHV
jgi:hypothetical protein